MTVTYELKKLSHEGVKAALSVWSYLAARTNKRASITGTTLAGTASKA